MARMFGIALWCALLLVPSAAVFSASHAWDVIPLEQLAWSLWAFALLWVLVGKHWFVILTYPLALFGAIALGADLLRNVNVLELLLVSGAGSNVEALAALRPYTPAIVTAAMVLLGCAALLSWDRPGPFAGSAPERRLRWMSLGGLMAAAVVLMILAPVSAVRAWPMNLLASAYATVSGRQDLLGTLLPYAPINPRKPEASWQATRARVNAPPREVYVLVIGESVRADRLQDCGGPNPVRPSVLPEALIYCDVVSGSSSTHTSVPLLLGRDEPGGLMRVSSDATVLKAFAEAGFRTYWVSVQEEAIAWPDAQRSLYLGGSGTDRARLIPHLRQILAEPHDKQLIVLHAYNAHFDYCSRYSPAASVAPVDCGKLGAMPSAQTRDQWLASYDNAVQESMLFLDEVMAALDSLDGEAFVSYVSDHGENILDDERGLFQHALAFPTRWDTRVPMIFWANDRWRHANASRWEQLSAHRGQRVMNADWVPTVLGAAGIGYSDRRRTVADLTRAAPAARTRWVLRRLGDLVDGDTL